MSIPERPAQLLLLQDSLIKLKDYEVCKVVLLWCFCLLPSCKQITHIHKFKVKCYSLDFLKICFGWGIGQEVFKEVDLRAGVVTNPKHKASTIQTLSTLHPNSTKFVVLLVTFDIMLGRHICLIQSCDIVIRKYFLMFHSEYWRVIERFQMTSWRPCWFTKTTLWELNSFQGSI